MMALGSAELITEREVRANFARVSHSTLWRWRRDGVFPKPIRVGPRRTFCRHGQYHRLGCSSTNRTRLQPRGGEMSGAKVIKFGVRPSGLGQAHRKRVSAGGPMVAASR